MNQEHQLLALKDNPKDLDLENFLTLTYCLVDELYQTLKYIVDRPGPNPLFSDSEVICLNLVGQMAFDSEKAWHGFVKKNYIHLFPKLLERSRYHRRCKDLQQITELMRVKLLYFMNTHLQDWFVMDSMPVPVCVYTRASRNLRFAADFQVDNNTLYGHCAAKKEDYYGFKLHLLVTTQGVPAHYVLAPSSHHDVILGSEVLESYRKYTLTLFDKGYVGLEKRLIEPDDYQLIIQKRDNQTPNTPIEKAFLGTFRKTIETTNSLLAGQFNLQFCRAKSAWGLTNRVIAKITALTLSIFINYCLDLPLLEIKNFIF